MVWHGVVICSIFSNKTIVFFIFSMQLHLFDALLTHVVKDFNKINWVAQSGLADNIAAVVKEYRTSRKITVSE